MKKRHLIKDLVKRRDEVIGRVQLLVQGKIPDKLVVHGNMDDFLMWILEPHVFEKWEPYHEESDDYIRSKLKKAYTKMEDGDNGDQEDE